MRIPEALEQPFRNDLNARYTCTLLHIHVRSSPSGTSAQVDRNGAPVETGRESRMKEPYIEGVANHDDPESCAAVRKDCREALTGARAGWVLSRENGLSQGADAVIPCGRPHSSRRQGEPERDLARSQTPRTHRSSLHGNREIRVSLATCGTAGRIGKVKAASR